MQKMPAYQDDYIDMQQRRAYDVDDTFDDHMRDSAYENAYDTAIEEDRSLRMLDENN